MTAVRRVIDADDGQSWTVVDDLGLPIEEVDDFLDYLHAIERSPNTQRAYAHDLKSYFEYLGARGVHFADVTSEDLGYFVRYLRRPDPDVALFSEREAVRTANTVNRMMAAVGSFYRFLEHRDGLPAARRLAQQARRAVHTERALLDGITAVTFKDPVVGPRLKSPKPLLAVLTVPQVHAIINATTTARDRLFFSLLATTGMRRGQALGLRHSDLDTRARTVTIVPRNDNANGARVKTHKAAVLPIGREIGRLYLDYMYREYGYLDSDYVFIKLAGKNAGKPLDEDAVDAIVRRLRTRVEFDGWSCHTLRHTFATLHHRAGMPIEIISHLLTHGSVSTTAEIYSHLDVHDLRQQLEQHGCWEVA